ncbi:MAG: L-histidine N(alpha)-methyltransferase [Cyanobacteria bacterium J06600_6]
MSAYSPSAKNRQNASAEKLKIEYLLDPEAIAKDDIKDVISGLQQPQKSIPPRYFYDAKGSQLFEAICQVPEYYPTRTEAGILEQYAQEIIDRTQAPELVELGSGSSTKTRYLFDAYQSLNLPLSYVPVDVSDSMLSATAKGLLTDYSLLSVRGKVATYAQALEQLAERSSGRRTIAFLGSSIGNFGISECDRFLDRVRSALNPGDYFLLGIDLQKPVEILTAAYNDAQGVTAAFNLNMLQHLNDRFEGNFCLDNFKHQAIYHQAKHQIEMYLISQQAQTVNLKSLQLNIQLDRGERVLTEISRKFSLSEMGQYLAERQLDLVHTYTDEQQWFGLLLCQLG